MTRSRFPIGWALLCGLAGFGACLLLLAVVMLWKSGLTEAGVAPTQQPDSQATTVAPAAGAEPASVVASKPAESAVVQVEDQSAASPPEVPPTAEFANSNRETAALLQSVAAEVAQHAEAAGAPPQFTAGKPSVLGSQEQLDTLTPPVELPPGMLPFLQGLDALYALEPAKAIAHFDQAIVADAQNSSFHTARGATYVLSEKMQQGLPDLQRAMQLDPNDILASRLSRLAWLMLGDQLKASKFYGHGQTGDLDFLIREVGVGYGSGASTRRRGRAGVHEELKAAAALQKLPTLMRVVANSFRTEDEQSSQALFALGCAQVQSGDFVAGRRNFEAVLVQHPEDFTSRYYYARCLLETGDPEAAREELTYLLCWSRFFPEAFSLRAQCAARQNDTCRAEHDLAIVESLDASQAAEAKAAVASAKSQPAPAGAEADAAAWDKLLESARNRASFEELTSASLALRRSVDARRKRWNEIYQDRLFDLVSAARAHAGDADRLADVAEFLRDNRSVRVLQVAPNGSVHALRRQTPETARQEIELAYSLTEEGLQSHPKHARCWAIKSAILLHTYGRLTEAEKSAEYAIQFDSQLIAGHMALSDCCEEYAVRLREKAAALRTPKTATRSVRVVDSQGNYVRTETETYSIPASPEELAQAAACDRQAEVYEEKEQVCLNNALAAAKGTPQEPFCQALMLFLKKDFQGARGWLEQAVAHNPDDPVMRHRLSRCLQELGLEEEATEEFARAINLQETTGEVWLAVAWTKLERTLWKDAAQAILRARELDPADARTLAYQGVLDEFGQQDAGAAQAATIAALAQEEARAQANHGTFLPAKDAARLFSAEDVGLTCVLRLKAAKSVFNRQPADAAAYYLATAGLEPQLSEWQLAKPVPSAMLPFPDRNPQQPAGAPPLVALLKNNRIFAGQALLNARRGPEAAAQFAAAENFANQLPAGGTAYLEFELEPSYVPFRVSSMPMYVKLLNGAALIEQNKLDQARVELQQVRYYLANRSLEQMQMTDDPIPAMYEQLAPAVGLR